MKNNYNFAVGDVVSGVITKILPYGVIVTLDSNAQGLVHISHLDTKFISNISDHFSLQDKITVKILSIDHDNNKIALSVKEAIPQQNHQLQHQPLKNRNNSTQSTQSIQPTDQNALNTKSHFETIMSNWQKESIDKIESINRRTKRRSN